MKPNVNIVPAILVLLSISGIVLVVCSEYQNNEAEAKEDVWLTIDSNEPNDYDELVTVVQELQKMVGILIDAGNTQLSSLEGLCNIDTSLLKRITEVERTIQPANSFVYIMLSEDIDVNGEKQVNLTADKRLVLARKAFEMTAKSEKESDPNCFWSRYDINSICIEGVEEPNEPECEHDNFYGISQGMSESDTYCGLCGLILKNYELGDADAVLHYHEPEPEPMKYSLPIPTWPDYIELEKDLVIDMSHKNDPNYPASYYPNWLITKGTKIYFKE